MTSTTPNNVDSSRGQWSGRLGFIAAAAGSSIGLGNIWKFPYITGENGGGAFVLVYLLCILLIAAPILIAEILIGRASQKAAVGAFPALAGRGTAWSSVGILGLIGATVLLSYYAVIGGCHLGLALNLYWSTFVVGALFRVRSRGAARD